MDTRWRYASLVVVYTLGYRGKEATAIALLSDSRETRVIKTWHDARPDIDPPQRLLEVLDLAGREGWRAGPSSWVRPSTTTTWGLVRDLPPWMSEKVASANEKYARPFDKGKVALASLFGTESWSDYGSVVLQMAILDTLLSSRRSSAECCSPRSTTPQPKCQGPTTRAN